MEFTPAKDLQIGVWYRMRHRRKGEAAIEIKSVNTDGCTGIIRAGRLRGINDEYQPGDEFSTGNNLATFEKLSDNEIGAIKIAKRFTVEEGSNATYRVKDTLTDSFLHSGLSKAGAEQRTEKLNFMEYERAFGE